MLLYSDLFQVKYDCDKFIASNIIYNNFSFKKEDITINEKYISMYGTNKNKLNVIDEPPD